MYGCGMAATLATSTTPVYDVPPSDADNAELNRAATYINLALSAEPEQINAASQMHNTESFVLTSGAMDENRPYCRSIYEFKGEFENELSFGIGEIIYLRRRVDEEWLEGELQGGVNERAGIFPKSFVEIVVDFPVSTSLAISSSSSTEMIENLGENFTPEFADSCTLAQMNLSTAETSSASTSGVALVMYDFEARYSDELSVRGGDSVKIIDILNENWAKCQNTASGKMGIVPQSFLQIFLENEPAIPMMNWSPLDSVEFAELKSFNGGEISSFGIIEKNTEEVPWSLDMFSNALQPSNLNGSETLKRDSKLENLSNEKEANETKNKKDTKTSLRLHPALPLIQSIVSDSGNAHLRQQRKPPQRPPPPSSASLVPPIDNGQLLSQLCVPQIVGPNRLSSDFQDQKAKIVQDFLLTETTYLFDLNSWEACILASTTLNDNNKRILNNGFPYLKDLSKKLIENFQAEKAKLPELQGYGQILMQMKEDFYRTFSYHCRCVEKISQILEDTADIGMKESLNKCVAEMRKMGSNVFDAPTALSRPIHRCLKYPLYVGELLKNTPINHIDHPKLMEALKQLGNLASKINECKRRKELIRKYTDDQQLTLAERFSRINVHSFVKKSNRLKYRISSTMGLNTIRDSEFNYLIAQLDGAERRVCKFLYCSQLYKKNIEMAFKKYEDSFRGSTPIDEERTMKFLCEFLDEMDRIRKNFLFSFETKILNEGRKLVRCDYTKLIHKRCDKLADYETARTTSKNPDEVEMRRNEYEALNNQVKNGMPKLITTINKKVVELVRAVHEIDTNLLGTMDSLLYKHRQSKEKYILLADAPRFSQFVMALLGTNRFIELNRILRAHGVSYSGQNGTSGADTNDTNRIVARRTASVKKEKSLTHKLSVLSTRQKFNGGAMARAQTPKERDALVKMMRAQNTTDVLRRITENFSVDNLLLNAGDVVLVKSQHKSGMCLCDNGVALGYVPLHYIRLFDDNELIGGDGSLDLIGNENTQALSSFSASQLLNVGCGELSKNFRPVSLPATYKQMDGNRDAVSSTKDAVTHEREPAASSRSFAFDNCFSQKQLLIDNFDAMFAAAAANKNEAQANSSLFETVNSVRQRSTYITSYSRNATTDGAASGENNLIDLSENLIDLSSP